MVGEHGTRELGLFILWQNARHLQDRILADLRSRFQVVRTYEVHWTPALVARNFERFYSDLDVRGVYHILNKGSGPFTAVTVIDPRPCFEARMTSRGERTVNARFLDAKQQYRDWTRGLEVHCGETPHETNRDLTMLLGMDAGSYLAGIEASDDPGIIKLNRDLTGATGWSSAAELFRVLGHTVNYVVLHPCEGPDNDRSLECPDLIHMMTDEYQALHSILNARPLLKAAPNGGDFRVTVDQKQVQFQIRFAGDQYYEPRWARHLLASRVLDPRGFYRPDDRSQFEALAYDALMHKPHLDKNTMKALSGMASESGISGWAQEALEHPRQAKKLLDKIMQDRGYSYVEPLDPGVFYNFQLLGVRRPALRQKAAGLQRYVAGTVRRLSAPILGAYLHGRDRLLLRAPWVRTVKRFVTTNPFARSER